MRLTHCEFMFPSFSCSAAEGMANMRWRRARNAAFYDLLKVVIFPFSELKLLPQFHFSCSVFSISIFYIFSFAFFWIVTIYILHCYSKVVCGATLLTLLVMSVYLSACLKSPSSPVMKLALLAVLAANHYHLCH